MVDREHLLDMLQRSIDRDAAEALLADITATAAGGSSQVFGDYVWVARDAPLAFTAAQNQPVEFDGLYAGGDGSIPVVDPDDLPITTLTLSAAGLYQFLAEAWMEGPNPGGQVVVSVTDAEDVPLPEAQAATFDFLSPTDDKRKATVVIPCPAGAKVRLAVANGATADPQDAVYCALFITRLL